MTVRSARSSRRACPPRSRGLVVTARDRRGEPVAFITAIPDRG